MEPLAPCSPPDLRHLRRLTDGFGVVQHTERDKLRLDFGYALDDVARALIVVSETARLFPKRESSVKHQESGAERTLDALADIYLQFIEHCQLPDGRFHNFVAADKRFRDEAGSFDSYGRTVWALGVAIHNARFTIHDSQFAERAAALLRKALPHFHDLPPLRSKAFTLLGLLAVLDEQDAFGVAEAAGHLADDLVHAYADAATPDWPWFESELRYSNGKLPHVLLAAAGNARLRAQSETLVARAREIGLASLDFLLTALPVGGIPAPVGNQWWLKGGTRPLYDQQCVDTAATVVAAAEAFRVTGEPRYQDAATLWWSWFFGNNTQQKSLYRPEDGAVHDGLVAAGVNENRGAESIIAFLMAHLKLAEVFCAQRPRG